MYNNKQMANLAITRVMSTDELNSTTESGYVISCSFLGENLRIVRYSEMFSFYRQLSK